MKVLQINATYGYGSTGLIMCDIGNALTNAGGQAFFAYQKANESIENGYAVGTIFDHKRHALLSRIFGGQGFYSRRATQKLCQHISEIAPNIVHLHNLHSNYLHLTMLLNYLAKHDIATVITMHDCWLFTGKCFHYVDVGCERFKRGCGDCPKKNAAPKSLFFDRSRRDLNRKIQALTSIPHLYIVGCSEWICNEICKSHLSKCNITRIYNGVDTSVFTPRENLQWKKELGLIEKKIIMGMANKLLLDVNKQILEEIVEGMADDCVLLIAGCTEPEKQKLKEYGEKVVAVGYTSDRDELAKLYSAADVFINPTHADTLPTVNMESICCGTPVVTFDTGGSPELIDDGTGIVVPESNGIAMMQGIETVLAKKMSDCAHVGKARFNKNECYQEYIKLYKKICAYKNEDV